MLLLRKPKLGGLCPLHKGLWRMKCPILSSYGEAVEVAALSGLLSNKLVAPEYSGLLERAVQVYLLAEHIKNIALGAGLLAVPHPGHLVEGDVDGHILLGALLLGAALGVRADTDKGAGVPPPPLLSELDGPVQLALRIRRGRLLVREGEVALLAPVALLLGERLAPYSVYCWGDRVEGLRVLGLLDILFDQLFEPFDFRFVGDR